MQKNLYKRVHAWMLFKFDAEYEKLVGKRKKKLFSGLKGTVVEIGPGTGANMRYFPKDISWIGIEPNRFMYKYLTREAARLGLENIELRDLSAEHLPFDDNSVDAVISTLVLCTVPNQLKTLEEIHRILKPKGKFIFMEHVAAKHGTWTRVLQTFVRPFWKVLADGCNPDRDTLDAIKRMNFSTLSSNRFSVYSTFVSPHISGIAVK